MKKLAKVLLVLVLILAIAAAGVFFGYRYLNQDMTGVPYDEIKDFMEEHPYVNVFYSVIIEGGDEPLVLTDKTTSVTLDSVPQTKSLIEQSAYLQAVTEIELGSLALTAEELEELQTSFVNAAINHTHINVLGTSYALSTTELDLSYLTPDQLDSTIEAIKPLGNVKFINLMTADGHTNLSVDDVLKLQAAYPNVQITYELDLLGQHITTDMTSLIWERKYIGDNGLAQIRKILPFMYNLTYLKLDDCGTSDEAMAQLREDFPDIEIHWRIFYSVFDCMTDNYKLWTIGGLMDKQIVDFVHLRGIKYMDLGHNNFTHLEFLKNLKDIEVLILAHGTLEDISGIKDCTKLTFLEIFSNRKLTNEDMQNLSGLVNLEYLNI
ncbi:MAG: hypothetical protein IJD81_01805, partial [Oscillospiraceae bacterium]|nr:hypothetical protein [Oscillospiraceae bacterium]